MIAFMLKQEGDFLASPRALQQCISFVSVLASVYEDPQFQLQKTLVSLS